MRTFGNDFKVEDENDLSIQSQLVLANMKIGETVMILNMPLEFIKITKTRFQFKWNHKSINFNKNIFENYGLLISTSNPNKKSGKGFYSNHLFRSIESELVLDKINSLNPFHELTDSTKLLNRDVIVA
jgi:hypothetical protein